MVQGQRRLVREQLSDADLLVVEHPPLTLADGEGADDAVVGDEGHREHGAVGVPLLGELSQLRRQNDRGVREQIGAHDRPAIAYRAANGSHPPRDARAANHGRARAGHGEGDQIAGFFFEPVHRGGLRAEQLPHAVADLLSHFFGVERARDDAPEIEQALGRAATAQLLRALWSADPA